jgi:hypothetical protein
MASKKTVKKTVKKAPAKKAAPRPAPAKKAPKPKGERKAKATKTEAPVVVRRKRQTLSMMLPAAQLSKEAKALIQKVDDIEVAIEDKKDEFKETLGKLQNAVGGSSFEHPTRGPMSIMCRKGVWFWRVKPAGAQDKAA